MGVLFHSSLLLSCLEFGDTKFHDPSTTLSWTLMIEDPPTQQDIDTRVLSFKRRHVPLFYE
jgi:hypothetical protein